MAGIAWVNGRLLPPDAPAISALDPGIMYGEGLFETMRAYGGRIFRLDRHLARLRAGACLLGLEAMVPGNLEHHVREALAASRLLDASVRLTITPGPGSGHPPTVIVLVRPLSLPPDEWYQRGCRVITLPVAISGHSPLRRVKSLNYLDKLLAQREARRAGADEAVLVDPEGWVVEGAMRNVFVFAAGCLLTPPASRGLLPGITREAVMEVGGRLGIDCREQEISASELKQADECFLTSSLAEILPVASVDGIPLRAGAPGPTTRLLTQGYRALVAEELGLPPGNRSG